MHGYKNIICLDVARSEIYVSEWRQTLSASNSVEATPLSSGKCSGKEMRPRYLLPPPPPQGWRDPPQHVSEERERVKGSLKRQCRRVLFRRFFFPRRHPRSPPSSHIWQRGRAGEEEPLLSLPLSSFSRRRSGKSSFFSLPPPSFQSVSACGGSKSEEAHRLVFQWHSFSPFLAWEGGATEFLSRASYLGRRRKFWFSLLPTEILVSVNIQCVLARKGRRASIRIFCLCF